ncbi:dihydrofolate reductase [Candidatus Woesearchaeota archaeon]|nr:dihydrofolate reductase [Candidatus Woesearchaeota archaeon]
MSQTVSLIAALGKNGAIGNENKLIWRIPADMKRFKELTTGKSVVMGRKTFESIGRPLPNRKNIVITSDRNYKAEGCTVVHSLDDALRAAGDGEVMIIGGAQIYAEFLPKADKMYLTMIEKEFEGDAYFPEYSKDEWKEISREEHADGSLRYSFVDFEKAN